jgi:hypothetical protein
MPAEVRTELTMSEDTHATDAPGHTGTADAHAADHHAPDDHGDDHGHDDHAHTEEPLGPIDVRAWGAGLIGVVLGLVMTLCFVLATA